MNIPPPARLSFRTAVFCHFNLEACASLSSRPQLIDICQRTTGVPSAALSAGQTIVSVIYTTLFSIHVSCFSQLDTASGVDARFTFSFPRYMLSTAISAGLTPPIRDACPIVSGRKSLNFSCASRRNPEISL